MKMNNVIKGGTCRYLSEIPEFKNGMPFGVINKTKPDVGGTYVAANCDSNYIIVCPFRDLVDSICADKNNKYEVFKCYGGTREYEWKAYCKRNTIHKIAVTYNSLPKLLEWIENPVDYKLLIDEYHLLLDELDYREDAINGLVSRIKLFKHYSLLSATPIHFDLEIDFIKDLPHYKVEWDCYQKIKPLKYNTSNVTKSIIKFIRMFLNNEIIGTDINNNSTKPEELYIFLNSVNTIRDIINELELSPEEVKICCASRYRNTKILGKDYEIEPVTTPNKKINFFTKKCFQGCNLFTNNGLIIVASDAYRTQTLVDISTTMEQIAGRLRLNDEYQNVFRNILIHIYSTNAHLISEEDFELEMEQKRKDAITLLEMTKEFTKEQMELFKDRVNLEGDIVSIIDDKVVINKLKEKSFIYKHKLRNYYKDEIEIRKQYNESEKFDTNNESNINTKLSIATTISYQQLLKDYINNPDPSYDEEYPEFKEIVKYLKESEMNTLGWNKDKMLKRVQDLKVLNKVFLLVHREGFISNAELKSLFKFEFDKIGLKITPKASLIEQCSYYNIKKTFKKINGKTVGGYELFPINLST